jgi:hypothetical protein
MNWMTLFILIGVALIDGKLWKIMKAQGDHHRKVEAFVRDSRQGSFKVSTLLPSRRSRIRCGRR